MYLYLCVHFGIYQSIKYSRDPNIGMVNQARVKLYEVKSRHSINFPSDFARDSAFPFKPGEELIAKIEGSRSLLRDWSDNPSKKFCIKSHFCANFPKKWQNFLYNICIYVQHMIKHNLKNKEISKEYSIGFKLSDLENEGLYGTENIDLNVVKDQRKHLSPDARELFTGMKYGA